MARKAAGASSAHVAQVAREVLARGNAVDAVVSAVLAAAADSPSVLLGPLQVLIGGAGAGLLAIDGRVRQPGMGMPRPRGVLAENPVPPQARVGVSALPAALAAALASAGRMTLTRAAGRAIEHARALSPERGAVIELVARHGAAVLAHDAIAVELIAVAGRSSGGALTRDDLASVRPAVVSCNLNASGVLLVPWRGSSSADASNTNVVAAIDSRGLAAIACYENALEGVAVETLGLVAPLVAAPVMRGRTRAPPGEACPAATPIALRPRRGVIELALGVALAHQADRAMEELLHAVDETSIAEALRACRAGSAVAIARKTDAVVVVSSA
jgi:hypothetical protein